MNKEQHDKTMFVSFCIEEYKTAKGLTGPETIDLFAKYGVTDTFMIVIIRFTHKDASG